MSLRRANPDDVVELVELRAAMYESWGHDHAGQEWRERAVEMFARRIREEPDSFVAYVVEDSDGRLVASGIGWVSEHLPSPWNPSGRRGHVASMSTAPDSRRQGHGRAIMEALLAWFAERSIARIDLVATAMGEPLYRRLGFDDHGDAVALVRRSEDHPFPSPVPSPPQS